MLGLVLSRGLRPRPALVVALVLLALGGCGGAPGEIGPSGVDQLTIPTPSPDPDDFVARVDNRWLPLADGTTWTFGTDLADAGETGTIDMEVSGRGPTIAGVATTTVQVTRRGANGDVLGRSASFYAQDRDGNVWLLGEESDDGRSWRAGSGGAEAGVAMPASPRLGDGYWRARAPGVTEQQVRVQSVGEALSTPWGELTDVLVVELTDRGASTTRWYAPGLGLVALELDGEQLALLRTSLDGGGTGPADGG